jgi:uncharacterized repeat protein (TIGR04138 family)
MIDGDDVRKTDLCEQCAGPIMQESKAVKVQKIQDLLKSKPSEGNFETSIKTFEPIERAHPLYPIEAYEFVIEALDFCDGDGPVSGRELLESIQRLAIRKFGRRAKSVLRNWKIFATEDFWNIAAIAAFDFERMDKRFKGSMEEFQNAFDFDGAFPEE